MLVQSSVVIICRGYRPNTYSTLLPFGITIWLAWGLSVWTKTVSIDYKASCDLKVANESMHYVEKKYLCLYCNSWSNECVITKNIYIVILTEGMGFGLYNNYAVLLSTYHD